MRTFFGVVCALLALLCGGCSLIFMGSSLSTNPADIALFLAIGGVPALVFGLSAWGLLRRKPAPPQEVEDGPPR